MDRPFLTDKELDELVARIALKVWAKVRRYIAKQQKELHDLMEEDD